VFMASITPPDLQPQHLGRVALVELLAPEAADHRAAMDTLNGYGADQAAAIWGRMLAGPDRYTSGLAAFREALGRCGCGPRQQDQLGAILAGFWVLTEDGVPDERAALNLVAAVREFVQDVHEAAQDSAGRLVADHLASSRLRGDRSSEEWPMAEMCVRVWDARADVEAQQSAEASALHWQERLGRNGLRAVCADQIEDRQGRRIPRGGPGDGVWIALRAAPIVALFNGTAWSGQRFRHVLRTLPDARGAHRRFAHQGGAMAVAGRSARPGGRAVKVARTALEALAELETIADWAAVTRLEARLRAAIMPDESLATGFFSYAAIVAELIDRNEDAHIRQVVSLAFAVAVAERLGR